MKPENVRTGTVVGRFLFGLGDGPDVGNEPDFVAARGRVTFIAGESTQPDPAALPAPVTLLLDPVVGVFDSEGYLCTMNMDGTAGVRGVKLIANDNPELIVQDWNWNVSYKFEPSTGMTHTIPAHGLYVYADGETDLVTAIKLPTSPGIAIEQVEAAVLRAEAEAAAAAQSVQEMAALATNTLERTFVEATVVGDDLVLARENGAEIVAGNVRGPEGPAGPNTVPTDQAVAGNVSTAGTLTRDAVVAVVDGRTVDTPQLADQAVTGGKIAPDSVGLDRLTQGMRDQFGQYEQQISDRPTLTATTDLANFAAEQARNSTAVITSRTYMGATYKLIRLVDAVGKPGLISKRFGFDDTSGTKGDGFTPPQENISNVFKRTGADIVIDAGGFSTNPADPRFGYMDGCQILEGVLYRDFNEPGQRGRDAIGVRYDGSIALYRADAGDTGASMVADGVRNSFSFGPSLVIAGVSQAVDATTISGRQVLAVTTAGDFLIITVDGVSGVSGLTYKQCADLCVELQADFAVPMDGGGSAQTMVQGNWTTPSSDSAGERATIDFLTVHAKIVGNTASNWRSLVPENGFTSTTAAVRQHDGVIEYQGSLVNEAATGTVQAATLPWWARPVTHQRVPATLSTTVGQYYDFEVGGALKMNTTSTNTGPRYISFVNYPAKPV